MQSSIHLLRQFRKGIWNLCTNWTPGSGQTSRRNVLMLELSTALEDENTLCMSDEPRDHDVQSVRGNTTLENIVEVARRSNLYV